MKINSTIKNELKRTLLNKIEEDAKKVIIESAYSLSNEQISLLIEKISFLRNKTIEFQQNKKLIAGFIIKQGTSVIDLSLLNKLLEIKKTLNEIS